MTRPQSIAELRERAADPAVRREFGDPQPHDLTECFDAEGYQWDCGRVDGLWSHFGGVSRSWHDLLAMFGPVTKYREVAS